MVLLFVRELIEQIVMLKGDDFSAEIELRRAFMPLKQYADVAELVRMLVGSMPAAGGGMSDGARQAILAGLDAEGGF